MPRRGRVRRGGRAARPNPPRFGARALGDRGARHDFGLPGRTPRTPAPTIRAVEVPSRVARSAAPTRRSWRRTSGVARSCHVHRGLFPLVLATLQHCYRFVDSAWGRWVPLPPSVKGEISSFASLCLLTEVDLSGPYDPLVHVGDSSTTHGYALL